VLHQDLGTSVNRAGGLVEDQQGWIGKECPGDGDQLLLTGATLLASSMICSQLSGSEWTKRST
jgi:hypothetical protein